MNEIIDAIILGVVQGVTEFLPVSSSGHLEIGKALLGFDGNGEESLMMTIILHAATALSTLIVFWKDVKEILLGIFNTKLNDQKHFALKVILSMIPAGLIGVFLLDKVEALFVGNLLLVGAALIITGLFLFVADRAKETSKEVSYMNAFIIGLAQAVAILPGISRSGATISTSVLLGIDKENSAKFSFLMVVPLILGKMLKDLLDGEFATQGQNNLIYVAGFIAALITGIFACKWMISIVKNSQLKYFAYYCFVVGLISILYSVL